MNGGDSRRRPGGTVQPAQMRLRLLDGFELQQGKKTVNLQPKTQELLAFLALRKRSTPRSFVASTLWLESTEQNAQASLRSTLWRLRQNGCLVVQGDGGQLQLAPEMAIDVHRMLAQARRVLMSETALQPGVESLTTLSGELLPGWWQEWVVLERERLRQLRLHALERLSERLMASGHNAQALDAALLAVAAEPLRESAQRLVISIQLAEGNQSEAWRQYTAYSQLLKDELGVSPSAHMHRLLAGVTLPHTSTG